MNKEEYNLIVIHTDFKELFEKSEMPYYIRNIIPEKFLDKTHRPDKSLLKDIPIYFIKVVSDHSNFRLHEYDVYGKILDYYLSKDKLFTLTPVCGISDGKTVDEVYLFNNGFKPDERTIYNYGVRPEIVYLAEYLGLLTSSDTKTYVFDCPPMGLSGEWSGSVNHKFIDHAKKFWLKEYHEMRFNKNKDKRLSSLLLKTAFEERRFFAGDNYSELDLKYDLSLSNIYAAIPNNIDFHLILNGDYNHFCIIDFGKDFVNCMKSFDVDITDNNDIKMTILDNQEKIRKVNYE